MPFAGPFLSKLRAKVPDAMPFTKKDEWIEAPSPGATLVRGKAFDFQYNPGFSIPEVQTQNVVVKIVEKPKARKLDSEMFDKGVEVGTVEPTNGTYPSKPLVVPAALPFETSKQYALAVDETRKDMNSQEVTHVYRSIAIHLAIQ